MSRRGRVYLFWAGLAILILASLALSVLLWLIFWYYPTNYHRLHWDYPTYFPTYFWRYYFWFILTGSASIAAGLYMMRIGLRKKLAP